MSHMVIFQATDGTPGYNQFETLDQAVVFVERLRNEQDVENSRIFRLEELMFDFRPYYKVAMAGQGDADASLPPVVETPAIQEEYPAPPLSVVEPIEEPAISVPQFEVPTYPPAPEYAEVPGGLSSLPAPPEFAAPGAVPGAVAQSYDSPVGAVPAEAPAPPRKGLFGR
ncbi:MAG TPA: hypothetical protein DEG43_03530 [Acidimicrobiaceae bacterium]|jgi:hypothetical protein|nr:hypothetical protein [Acidimicrobiaceae bacterium]